MDGEGTQEGIEFIDSACGRFRYCFWTRDIEEAPLMFDDVDIGLVPNRPHAKINLAKSDLKGLEMAGMGVPCIASPLRSYRAWRREGTGCIVLEEHATRDWIEALRRMIEDAALRRRMADEALAFAQTRSIDVWAPKWMEAYQEAARRTGKPWSA
jgi:glycosyltransferase involved in cell wall biosynthesis